ncbi:MAG: winged helix-turn-helix domain-containing protein [Armatimonadetes bacterium]|nr:winged helix-turn-helix domain-containing protein [Armatimonadota bacterium]
MSTPAQSVPIKIRLFGPFHLEGGYAPIKLSSAKILLALLCSNPGHIWPREHLAQSLWPHKENGSRDHLRTIISLLKKSLGDAVEWGNGRNAVEFRPIKIEVDLWQAQELVRNLSTALDTGEEQQYLCSLVELIQDPLMADQPDFLTNERAFWKTKLLDSLFSLAELFEAQGDHSSAVGYLERALLTSPYNEKVWFALVRQYSSTGRHVEICSRFYVARRDLQKSEGSDFSPSLKRYVQETRRSGAHSSNLSVSQEEMVCRTVGRMIEHSPDQAAEFFGSEEFRLEVFRVPQVAASLLEKVIGATSGTKPARMRCAVFAMMANTLIGRAERLLSLGDEVLALDSDHARLRAAATMVANAHVFRGEWEESLRANDIALEHAIALGNMPGIDVAMAQRAIFEWEIEGNHDAIQTLIEIEVRLSRYDEHNARAGRTTISFAVGMYYLGEGNFTEARLWLSRSERLARQSGHTSALVQVLVPLGVTKLLMGEGEGAIDQISKGLAETYRLQSDRLVLLAIDVVASGLKTMGKPSHAKFLLTQTIKFRKQKDILLAPTHQELFNKCLSGLESASDLSIPEPKSCRDLVTITMDAIRSLMAI